MKRLPPLLLFLHTTPTSAWTFTWRNASSSSFLKNSHDPLPCTNIDQAKGQEFDFHPESDNYNFYIWATENCTGDYAGYTTPDIWRKKASKDMRSYLVDYGDGTGPKSTALASASTATATATATSSASTESSTTTSSTETAASSASASTSSTTDTTASASSSPDTDSGSTISGGAIAGIVIAIVAGLSILGAGFFYLGRRARRGNNDTPSNGSNPSHSQPQLQNMYPPPGFIPPSSSHGPGAADSSFGGTSSPYQQSHGAMQQQQQHQQQSMLYYGESSPLAQTHSGKQASQKAWVELPGEDMAAELSVSRQVNELEGHSKMMYQ